MFPIPTSIFLTRGVGTHRHQLTAFEFALRDADIEQQNLVSAKSWRRSWWWLRMGDVHARDGG